MLITLPRVVVVVRTLPRVVELLMALPVGGNGKTQLDGGDIRDNASVVVVVMAER